MILVVISVKMNKHDTYSKITYRILQENKVHNKLTNKNVNYRDNYKLFDGREGLTTYAKLKEKNSNNFVAYKKPLKRDYSKMKGLKKLDCFCEERVFNAIESFDKTADNMKCSKKIFFKIILKKYAVNIICFCFFICFGNIIPIFNILKYKHKDKEEHISLLKYVGVQEYYYEIYHPLLVIIYIIIMLASIYILIKIVKYDGIKAGKIKMKAKEYFSFIKKTYINNLSYRKACNILYIKYKYNL
ncbi:Plasmodium exported protein, unknown function [Plasmodium vivax]|uniref:Variable surface protein n=1 Tax=Plasmodium vivax TaxID=5855 RepID=A0A565A658_PLAVI|nr:Plasmodium exported protein, unknown function [Plasmodium vivax]